MDFLDRFALWVGNSFSSSSKNKAEQNITTEEGSISAESDIEPFGVEISEKEDKTQTSSSLVEKRKMKRDLSAPRASYIEIHFKNPDKILNDIFAEEKAYNNKRNSILSRLEGILPFVKHKFDFFEWLFRNRTGFLVVFLVYITLIMSMPFIAFNFDIIEFENAEGILIDFEKDKELEKIIEQLKRENNFQNFEDIANRVSDENSEVKEDKIERYVEEQYTDIDSEKLLEELANQGENNDYMNNHAAELAHLELYAQDELNAFYKQREAGQKAKKSSEGNEFTKKSGNVTVTYDLKGRRALFLEVPSYLCRGGGKVVVNISVNKMGDVVSATVYQTIGVTDPCLTDKAIWAAKRTKFNYKADAEARQKGTITYMFVAQ